MSDGLSMTILGVKEVQAAMSRLAAESQAVATEIVQASQAEMERRIKESFTQRHSRRTPTPSSPGSPPAVVTGQLRRSVKSFPVRQIAGGAIGQVAPTAIYARIQELGGVTGRNHATTLPARPYVRPTLDAASARLEEIAAQRWDRMLRG